MLDLALALVAFGLIAGAVAAGVAAVQRWRQRPAWRIQTFGGVALGMLAVIVSTRTGTLEALPLTLLAGLTLAGPAFVAAWWLISALVGWLAPGPSRSHSD